MDSILGLNGVILNDNDVREKFKHKYLTFLSKLTKRTRQQVGMDKVATVYKHDVIEVDGEACTILHIPRDSARLLVECGILSEPTNTLPEPKRVRYNFIGQLFDNQNIVVDWLTANKFSAAVQKRGFGTATLNMQAGSGKTFVAAALIAKIGYRALYIVMRRKLQSQTCDDFALCFDENTRICKANTVTHDPTSDIVVMNIDSAVKQPDSFFASFGLIIFDEVHMYVSKIRSEIFWKSNVACVLGMSATTNERSDGFDFVYHKHLGAPIKATELPGFFTEDTSQFTCKVVPIKYYGPAEYTKKIVSDATGFVSIDKMLGQLISDMQRNELCVQLIFRLYDQGLNIFGFSSRRLHLDVVESMILEEFKKRNINNADLLIPELALMRGGTPDEILKQANTARIILTTYEYGGTGISIVRMTAAVYMTPRRNGHLQFNARILRRGSDTKIVRWIYDIVDWSTTLKSQYYDRADSYRTMNIEILDYEVVRARAIENANAVDNVNDNNIHDADESADYSSDSDSSDSEE